MRIKAVATGEGDVMEARPFTSKSTIEKLSPANLGLLEE